MKPGALVLGVVLVGMVTRAHATRAPECVNTGLVMVNATFDNSPPERSAGHVVKIEDRSVVVITAAHVVRNPRLPKPEATTIKVGFQSLLPLQFPATIIDEVYVKEELAILQVEIERGTLRHNSLCPLEELNDLKNDDPIYYVGHPAAPLYGSWVVGSGEIAGFNAAGGVWFRIGSTGSAHVHGGFSGGALYNKNWRVVGMIVSSKEERQLGSAISLRSIVNALKSLKNPISADLRMDDEAAFRRWRAQHHWYLRAIAEIEHALPSKQQVYDEAAMALGVHCTHDIYNISRQYSLAVGGSVGYRTVPYHESFLAPDGTELESRTHHSRGLTFSLDVEVRLWRTSRVHALLGTGVRLATAGGDVGDGSLGEGSPNYVFGIPIYAEFRKAFFGRYLTMGVRFYIIKEYPNVLQYIYTGRLGDDAFIRVHGASAVNLGGLGFVVEY